MRSSIPVSAVADPGTAAAPNRSLARGPLFAGACVALLVVVDVGLFAGLLAPFSPSAIDVWGGLGLLAGLGRGAYQVLGRVRHVFRAFPPVLLAIGIAAVLGAGGG